MKNPLNRISIFPILTGLILGSMAMNARADFDGIDKHKLIIKAFVDYGHIVNGYNYYDPDHQYDLSWLTMNRANVMAIQNMTIGNFDLSAGLSGLIWWPYGGGKSANLSEKVLQVKPMVPVAMASYRFGDPASLGGNIQVGTFNYKYNPDAKNLGEYLYRSGTYPGMLWTSEGWLLMNRAGNYSTGALFTLSQMGGMLKHNFSLFMETVNYPVGDFSPGYDVSLTTKVFEIGAGVVLNHYLALHPSQLTPDVPANTYQEFHGLSSTGADTILASGRADQIATPPTNATDTITTHWTQQGIKLMGRVALNLGFLLPEAVRGPEDLRLFAEVALLGVKDYPLYYEKKMERMPIMFGLNIPTAKLLDVLTVQGEYYKSPYNDATKFVQSGLPIPEVDGTSSPKAPSAHGDDFKWSVYGKKSINKLINVYTQIASDHLRMTDAQYNPSGIPLTTDWKHDWYYLVRLEFNLR